MWNQEKARKEKKKKWNRIIRWLNVYDKIKINSEANKIGIKFKQLHKGSKISRILKGRKEVVL